MILLFKNQLILVCSCSHFHGTKYGFLVLARKIEICFCLFLLVLMYLYPLFLSLWQVLFSPRFVYTDYNYPVILFWLYINVPTMLELRIKKDIDM